MHFSDVTGQSFAPPYFHQLRLQYVLIPRTSCDTTSIGMHLWLLWCTSVLSGRFPSKHLSVKTAVSYICFTCLFSATDGGECLYNFSVHLRPYFLHSSQCTLRATLSWGRLYSFCSSWVKPLTTCCTVFSSFPTQSAQGWITSSINSAFALQRSFPQFPSSRTRF